MIDLRQWLMWKIFERRPSRKAPRKPRRGPERSPEYRAFVRQFPCCACGVCYNVEAAHTGAHALSMKSSDRYCVPLCQHHHRIDNQSLHVLGPRKFQELWNLDFGLVIADLNRQWRQR